MVRMTREAVVEMARRNGTPIPVELQEIAALEGQEEEAKGHKYHARKDHRPCYNAHESLSGLGWVCQPSCAACKGRGLITFDSKAEAHRYSELVLMLSAGVIKDLQLQVAWGLHCPDQVNGVHRAREVSKYISDFVYTQLPDPTRDKVEQTIVEDVKGVPTPMYRLKRKWMELEHGIRIKEIRREKRG